MTTTAEATVTRLYTVSEVIALTGATYRFLDHACRAGYLRNPSLGRGSGTQRRFTEREIDTIHAAWSLIKAGFTYAAAWRIAAELTDHDEYRVVIGQIFELHITVRDTSSPADQPAGEVTPC